MARATLPRIVVAGLAGDAGKTLVTIGLARALVRRGQRVAPFKCGPDFIDAAWLGAAARAPGRNLDAYLMPREAIAASVQRAARSADLAIVEGKRGLFDGVDVRGTYSTAQLAKLVRAPVVLVVNAAKVTRTVSALVLGCRAFDPELDVAGVILNRVATGRQESLIRRALAADTRVPLLGAIPRMDPPPLCGRHLGLVCAAEHADSEAAVDAIADLVAENVDLEAVRAIAARAGALDVPVEDEEERPAPVRARIGVLRDSAFSLYYPENLEALEAAGAEIVPVSPLADHELPAIDALYAGGGFPEEHAPALAANVELRAALASAIADGMPTWAECGGLMYLARAIVRDGRPWPMVGALPVVVEHTARPQGHGYTVAAVDRPNPFLSIGTRLSGHEFHHSRIAGAFACDTSMAIERGSGVGHGREGLAVNAAIATYMHVHALGAPEWAPSLVLAAVRGLQPRAAAQGMR